MCFAPQKDAFSLKCPPWKLVSDGGLEYCHLSSTIWNQCSWGGKCISLASKQPAYEVPPEDSRGKGERRRRLLLQSITPWSSAQWDANLPSIYSDVWTAQASLSSIQGWPISFGVQSLLLFLAPFEIGYSEGQISSYPAELFATEPLSLFHRLDWLRWILFMLFRLLYPTCISHWYLDWCLQRRKMFSDLLLKVETDNFPTPQITLLLFKHQQHRTKPERIHSFSL